VATLPTPNGSGDPLGGLTSRAAMLSAPVSPAPAGGPAGQTATAISIPLLPGQQTIARRIRFTLVNACTIGSIVLGLGAVFLALHGQVRLGALVLMGCVVFDGLDGGLARRFGVASPFGAQMDSLADMCSFGLATPLLAYFWLRGEVPTVLLALVCALATVCAAVRLARFNVSPKNGRYFCGVPTTMSAAILAVSVLLSPEPGSAPFALAVVGALALLMVSSFPYAKLAQIAKLPPWLWVLPVVGAFVDVPGAFAILVAGYLLSGPLLWLRYRQSGRTA
jgi:CDP-diacylglycerol--serine O-phosphatidyltransferase